MTKLKKVWVIQEGRNDYSSAEEQFGEVNFVTKGDYRPMQNSQQNIEVMADIRKFKTLYLAGTDYIIPAGNPMIVALIIMAIGGGNHNFLKWDGRRAAYVPFTLNPEMVK